MNWFMIAGGLLVVIGIIFLIKYLIGNTTSNGEKTEIPEIPIEPSIKAKMSYGKIWNWVIPILIISAIIGAILIVPKYYNKSAGWKSAQVNAVFSWEKEPSQYGLDPEIRRSIPMEAVITRNDADVFNFVFYYYSHRGIKEAGVFEGEKTATGRIEGTWRQDRPKDGGEWYLEQNSQRLFTGKHRDRSGDWIPMKLKIKLN